MDLFFHYDRGKPIPQSQILCLSKKSGSCHISSIQQVFGMVAEEFWALLCKHTLFPRASSTVSHIEYKLMVNANQCWFMVSHAAILVTLCSYWIFMSDCMFTHILPCSLFHEWVMKAFLFLNLEALLFTDSCVKVSQFHVKNWRVAV